MEKIVLSIIEEAQTRRDMDITDALSDVQASAILIICRLCSHIRNILKQKISDQEKDAFIQHLLKHPF
ncbi:hypothetical protein ES703_96690 [subsurface metagenome]